MGEMADDILDGLCCEICGVYFEDEDTPGYPRRCSGGK
jgi:hypothetical protein